MARIADTIAALDVGAFDGEPATLRYGSERAALRWNAAAAKWYSDARLTICFRGDWRMGKIPSIESEWTYLADATGPPGEIGQAGFGWSPVSLLAADDAYDAGLVLEENLSCVFWTWTPGCISELAIVRYPLDDGDVISPLIDPSANISVTVDAFQGERKWQTTGWTESDIPTPTKPLLAPHFYMSWRTSKEPTAIYLETTLARWRWAGEP